MVVEDDKTERNCDWCGKLTHVQPSCNKRYRHHYCNRTCFQRWRLREWMYPSYKEKMRIQNKLEKWAQMRRKPKTEPNQKEIYLKGIKYVVSD